MKSIIREDDIEQAICTRLSLPEFGLEKDSVRHRCPNWATWYIRRRRMNWGTTYREFIRRCRTNLWHPTRYPRYSGFGNFYKKPDTARLTQDWYRTDFYTAPNEADSRQSTPKTWGRNRKGPAPCSFLAERCRPNPVCRRHASRVGHIFGFIEQIMWGLVLRRVELARAKRTSLWLTSSTIWVDWCKSRNTNHI